MLGTIPLMAHGDEFTREQELLKKIRKEYCGDVAAELARRIDKDVTYVNRLFYPVGKKGRKGIGLEIMQACTRAFKLPPGFWEGADEPRKGEHLERMTDDEQDVLDDWRAMDDDDREELKAMISKRAEKMRHIRARMMAELGIPIAGKAAAQARAKQIIARASADPTQQRELPLGGDRSKKR